MLFIALRNNKAVFAQGEEVAGEVTYQPGNAPRPGPGPGPAPGRGAAAADGVAPVRITVELVGYSETQINISTNDANVTYRGRADLLRVPVADFSGPPYTTFRFSAPFPATTSPVDRRVHTGFRSKRTAHMVSFPAIHPLPPSFRLDVNPLVAESHGFYTEYMIRASVWPILGPNGVADPLLQQDIKVRFQPRMAPQMPPGEDGEKAAGAAALAANYLLVQANHRVKSLRLSPEHQNRKLSLREKSMSVFQRSKLPYFDFCVQLQQPAQVHVGQKVVCYVHLDLCPETSTAPQPPTFTLKTFKFLIEATCELHGTRFSEERCEEQLVELKARRDDLGDFVPQTGYTKTVMAALFTVPTFATFNINRSYVLETRAEVACVEKVYRIINRTKLTVLPALWGDGSTGTSAALPAEEFGAIEYLDGGGGGVDVRAPPPDKKS